MMAEPEAEFEANIASLGHLGDGVAETAQGQIFIPFALPGERVKARKLGSDRAQLLSILAASPERVTAPCRHFGICGGCSLQHLEKSAYAAWKHAQVTTALKARGIEVEVAPLIAAAPHARRRATLAATRTKKGVTFGFYASGSHTIIAAEECPLLVPAIEKALPALARLVEPGLSRKGRASVGVTATETGLDVYVTGGKDEIDLTLRNALTERATAMDLARLTWNGEILAERRAPLVTLGKLRIAPPPGAFLQPTLEGQAALIRLVREGVGDALRVADLFAGCGTFTAPLAEKAKVLAVESEASSIASLDRAIRLQGPALGLKPVALVTRDLFRRPMLKSELAKCDAVVFDPPRAGAEAQARELASSTVPAVIGVSCNPATFARDAKILIEGGYKLNLITPVDQFLWSSHVELVGIFNRL